MQKIQSIAKNTSYFTLALIIQKVISFAYFAVLARNLAPAELGQYYLAISFTTIFAIFVDLGLANILVALMLAFTLGALIGIALILIKKKTLKSEIPFGTFLTFSTFIVMIFGQKMVEWYWILLNG